MLGKQRQPGNNKASHASYRPGLTVSTPGVYFNPGEFRTPIADIRRHGVIAASKVYLVDRWGAARSCPLGVVVQRLMNAQSGAREVLVLQGARRRVAPEHRIVLLLILHRPN